MGDSDLTIDASNTVEYTDEGATCNDYVDGVLSHAVEVSGHVVNMQQPGVYTIKYDCADIANNPATQMTRKVTVVDRTCPTITIKGESTIYLEAGFDYTDQGADGYDDLDVTTHVTTVNSNIYTDKYHRARSCSEIRQVAWKDYAGGWNGVPAASTTLHRSLGERQVCAHSRLLRHGEERTTSTRSAANERTGELRRLRPRAAQLDHTGGRARRRPLQGRRGTLRQRVGAQPVHGGE